MSRSDRTASFTRRLFELEEALENNDKKYFIEKLKEHAGNLHNCSCGDSVLGNLYNKVLRRALEKFII